MDSFSDELFSEFLYILHMEKRLVIPLSPQQHQAIKIAAAREAVSIKRLVLNALQHSNSIPPAKATQNHD